MAKRTMLELTTKLKAVKDSKESAIAAAEHVRKQAKQLEEAKSQKNIPEAGLTCTNDSLSLRHSRTATRDGATE